MSRLQARWCAPLAAVVLAACMAAPPQATPTPILATPPGPPTPTLTHPGPPSPATPPAVPGPGTAEPASPVAPATPSAAPSPSAPVLPGGTPSPGLVAPSPSTPGTLAETYGDALQAALDDQRDLRRIPGISAVVVFPDGSRWSGASGMASLEPAQPATPDTPYSVGSITKTFVTALVLQLAEERVLRLDAPLARWLPDYPRARRITLRHLLSHTSGVFNYFEHPDYERLVFGRPEHEWQPLEVLETFERPPYFAPGTGFYYSNTNFVLLGLVVEEATGRRLGELLEERFIGPLGLTETYFQDSPPPPGAAGGYLRAGDGHIEVSGESSYRPTTSAATVAWAAGAMIASADDLADWAQALYGGDLLSAESTAQLLDYTYAAAAQETYALGTRTRLVLGARSFGHTGSLRGYIAAMWHFPEMDLTVALTTNVGRIDGNRVSDALATVVLPDLGAPGSLPTPPPTSPKPASPGSVNATPQPTPAYEP